MTKIIRAYPPNFPWLRKVFPISGRPGIVYAYGERIYNPSGGPLSPWVRDHEEVHCKRQLVHGVGAWWDAYSTNKAFRLEEEILAHQAEWDTYTAQHLKETEQNNYLWHMATRLSSPLYGSMCSFSEAMEYIRATKHSDKV